MVSLTEVRASNSQVTPVTIPQVSVFVGATSGIGKATLTKLVSTGFPLKAYIIGRDAEAFQPTLSELQALNPSATLIFLQGEISLLAEVKRLTDVILSRENGIDLIFLTSGFLPFLGRQETTEGVEVTFAVSVYSRLVFIRLLLPLLRVRAAAWLATQGLSSYRPRIVNILGAGAETANPFLDDLQLKEPGRFSVPNYVGHSTTIASVNLKWLAEQAENKDIVIIHAQPGLVSTDLFKKSWGDQWGESKAQGSAGRHDIERSTPEEAGERSFYLMTSAKYGGNGLQIGEGQEAGLTVEGKKDGSLLNVNDKLETLSGDLLNSFVESGAADAILGYTSRLIGSYL